MFFCSFHNTRNTFLTVLREASWDMSGECARHAAICRRIAGDESSARPGHWICKKGLCSDFHQPLQLGSLFLTPVFSVGSMRLLDVLTAAGTCQEWCFAYPKHRGPASCLGKSRGTAAQEGATACASSASEGDLAGGKPRCRNERPPYHQLAQSSDKVA